MAEAMRYKNKGHEVELCQVPDPASPTESIWQWSVFAEDDSGDGTRQLLGSGEHKSGPHAQRDASSFISSRLPGQAPPPPYKERPCERCGQNSDDGESHAGGGRLCEKCLHEVEWIRIYLMVVPNETWCPNCHRVLTRYEKRGAVWGWFPRACLGRLGCVELRGKQQAEGTAHSSAAAGKTDV